MINVGSFMRGAPEDWDYEVPEGIGPDELDYDKVKLRKPYKTNSWNMHKYSTFEPEDYPNGCQRPAMKIPFYDDYEDDYEFGLIEKYETYNNNETSFYYKKDEQLGPIYNLRQSNYNDWGLSIIYPFKSIYFCQINNSENPMYMINIRTNNKDSLTNEVEFEISNIPAQGNELYNIFSNLYSNISNKEIKSIALNHGNNNFRLKKEKDIIKLIATIDKSRFEQDEEIVDILIGDNLTCKEYKYIKELYKSLSKLVETKKRILIKKR